MTLEEAVKHLKKSTAYDEDIKALIIVVSWLFENQKSREAEKRPEKTKKK